MRRFTNTTRRHYACSMVLALTLSTFLVFRSDAQSPQSEDVKPVPLFTGSAGFLTSFDGGEAHLGPIVSPVLLIPLKKHWLLETRATFESDMVQEPGLSGFHGKVAKAVDYAQLDFVANAYLTVTVGRFLTPFGIFNERLYPVWIRNLQTDPLILAHGNWPQQCEYGSDASGRL